MEEEAKKIQPLRPLSAADTGDQYPLAAEGGSIRRFDVGGSNSISLDDLNEALRDRAPTIPEQFNRYIAPHIQRGLDAMLPFRQLAQKTFERNVYNPLNESVINNISSAIKTSGTNANDVNDAKIHIANAARKAIGMEPRPVEFDAQKALGDINEGEFDRQYVDMDKRHAQRLEELKKLIAQRKANGGQVDMDRMRLELMNKGGVLPRKKRDANLEKFLSKSHVKHPLYHGTSGKDFDNPVGTTYLSNLPHIANTYAGKDAVSPRVMPVYANMENPLVVNSHGENWDTLPTNTTVKGKRGHDTLKDIVGDDYPTNEYYDTGHVADYARKHGYDSVIFKHLQDVGAGELEGKSPFSDVHVVFDPESQLKSAVGNRGTYNKKTRDITKKNGGITHAHQLDIEERPL
jgi:hypothetical protein